MYDPGAKEFRVWLRHGDQLEAVEDPKTFQSPRLNVRFRLTEDGLKVQRPDGSVFESYLAVWQRASDERQRAERERQQAQRERQRADQERARAERLAKKLRDLGVDPDE